MRVGFGYDVHRLVEGRRLILGGVQIPYEKGLLGHSDADVLLHAIMDAMLGAVAKGDIGKHFPDTDYRYKDADSIRLLEETDKIMKNAGFKISNIDTTIVAESPKLAPYIDRMRANISETLSIDIDQVNIKGTTTEGLGYIGEGEGMAAYAVVCVEPDDREFYNNIEI